MITYISHHGWGFLTPITHVTDCISTQSHNTPLPIFCPHLTKTDPIPIQTTITHTLSKQARLPIHTNIKYTLWTPHFKLLNIILLIWVPSVTAFPLFSYLQTNYTCHFLSRHPVLCPCQPQTLFSLGLLHCLILTMWRTFYQIWDYVWPLKS